MSTQLLSYDQFTDVRYPRVWQWAMVIEIALTFLLLNVFHDLQTVAVVGVYGWVVAMLGISYLGIRLSQMKSPICDRWIQSKYLYRFSGIGLILIILYRSYVVPQMITSIDLNIPRNWIIIISILVIQLLILGIAPFLLNRKWQYPAKSFTMVWPFFLLVSWIWWTLDTPDNNLWFILQTRLMLIGVTILFYVFGNIYEPNRTLLVKKEVREVWKWFVASLVGVIVIGFIFRKMDMQVYYAGMGMLYISFYAIFLGARAYAGERENHTFDYLSIRPIEPKTILGVKYKIGFIQVLFLTFMVTGLSEGTMEYLQVKMEFSPFLNFLFTLWLYSFSFLVSLVTRDTIRAVLIGFAGGVVTFPGAFALSQPQPLNSELQNMYYIYILIILLTFIFGVIGVLLESIQHHRMIWKNKYGVMILLSICLYFYGLLCFYGNLKPTTTIAGIMRINNIEKTFNQGDFQRMGISSSRTAKYVWEFRMFDFSNPLNPVLLKPHFHIKNYQYEFINSTTMITMEYDKTGSQLVVYDFTDLARPREAYRKTLSTDTDIVYNRAYRTRNMLCLSEVYRDTSKKKEQLLEQLVAEAKKKASKINMPEIYIQLRDRLQRGYIQINRHDYHDIQSVSFDKTPEIFKYSPLNYTLGENYIVRLDADYNSLIGKTIIYDVRDESHPKAVYQSQINRDYWQWSGCHLWGHTWSELTVQGNYLYGSNQNDMLAVYNIQNIQNPQRLGSLPWSMLDNTALTSMGEHGARYLTIQGNLIVIQYVRGFAMVDISNPNKPVLLGKYNVHTDDGFLQGNYYYAWNYKDMYIFDISKFIGRKS